jgi:hypothetical protein
MINVQKLFIEIIELLNLNLKNTFKLKNLRKDKQMMYKIQQ